MTVDSNNIWHIFLFIDVVFIYSSLNSLISPITNSWPKYIKYFSFINLRSHPTLPKVAQAFYRTRRQLIKETKIQKFHTPPQIFRHCTQITEITQNS
jgi:hypothetical protein